MNCLFSNWTLRFTLLRYDVYIPEWRLISCEDKYINWQMGKVYRKHFPNNLKLIQKLLHNFHFYKYNVQSLKLLFFFQVSESINQLPSRKSVWLQFFFNLSFRLYIIWEPWIYVIAVFNEKKRLEHFKPNISHGRHLSTRNIFTTRNANFSRKRKIRLFRMFTTVDSAAKKIT